MLKKFKAQTLCAAIKFPNNAFLTLRQNISTEREHIKMTHKESDCRHIQFQKA